MYTKCKNSNDLFHLLDELINLLFNFYCLDYDVDVHNDEETFDMSDSEDYQSDDHVKAENGFSLGSNKKPRRRRTAFTQVHLQL